MSTWEPVHAVSPAVPGAWPLAQQREETGIRTGLRVDLLKTQPGEVRLSPLPGHYLRINAGDPVRAICGAKRILYKRGDTDLLPAGLSDIWREDDAGTSLMVRISPSLVHRAAQGMGLGPGHAGLELRHQFRDPRIEHIAWALDAERREGYPNGLLYTESLGMAIAVQLLRDRAPRLPLPRGLSKPQLRRLTEYIEEHLGEDLSLASLAAVSGVSESHLKTLFRQSMGLPVHQYVIQQRVHRAKDLLLRGKLPASQIALEAGFAHQSHMARCMRKVLGIAPSSLARHAREE